MEFMKLFNTIPRELQIMIAVEYLGDWKYKNGKLVYDFTNLYNKIPKIKHRKYSNIVYDTRFEEYVYTVQKTTVLRLKINKNKKYVFECSERRTYREDEIEEVIDFNDEGDPISTPYVDPRGGNMNGLYYLQLVHKDYYHSNDSRILTNKYGENNTIIIDNMDKYIIKEKILFVYF